MLLVVCTAAGGLYNCNIRLERIAFDALVSMHFWNVPPSMHLSAHRWNVLPLVHLSVYCWNVPPMMHRTCQVACSAVVLTAHVRRWTVLMYDKRESVVDLHVCTAHVRRWTVLLYDKRESVADLLDDVVSARLLRELIDWATADPLMAQLADTRQVGRR